MLIALLPGDGIGPEVIREARRVLDAVCGDALSYEEALVGAAAYRAEGHPLPSATLDLAKRADAILFGAVGDPACDGLARHLRPEQAILGLRKELSLFANLRPAKLFPRAGGCLRAAPRSGARDRSGHRSRDQWRRLFRREGHAHHAERPPPGI